MSEGKTSRYLTYAVGEIILVVIGILIALQINNWNGERKNLKLEGQYKERLIEQFQKDSIYLSKIMKGQMMIAPLLKELDSLLNLDHTSNPSVRYSLKIPVLFSLDSQFITNTSVIEELNNTGNMSIIRSIPLRDALISYQNIIFRQINTHENTKVKRERFDNYLIDNGSLERALYTLDSKYVNSGFKNLFWYLAAMHRERKENTIRMIDKCNEILQLIRT